MVVLLCCQVKQARSVAQATSSLVNAIKGEALEQKDVDMQKRLLGAAQALADATYKMVEAAKVSIIAYDGDRCGRCYYTMMRNEKQIQCSTRALGHPI